MNTINQVLHDPAQLELLLKSGFDVNYPKKPVAHIRLKEPFAMVGHHHVNYLQQEKIFCIVEPADGMPWIWQLNTET